jgi:hypothetical protein
MAVVLVACSSTAAAGSPQGRFAGWQGELSCSTAAAHLRALKQTGWLPRRSTVVHCACRVE